MRQLIFILIVNFTITCGNTVYAQDSTVEALVQIPQKYLSTVDKKIDKYTSQVSSKTIKTLEKLSKWESKIKNSLQKVHPEAVQKLFGNNQLSFAALLDKLKHGEQIALEYRKQYDRYRDNITTNITYLEKQKDHIDETVVKQLKTAKEKAIALNNMVDSTEAIQAFIQERKKELIKTAITYIGANKYLVKMNKETFYYLETLKNYKEILSDEAKIEQTVKQVLNNIPAFQNFFRKNSMLASIFSTGVNADGTANTASLAGLQTRAQVQNMIRDRIASGGPNAQQAFSQNIQAAQSQLQQYKDKLLKNPNFGNGGGELPDFKPNMQKTKSLLQRLEFGSNLQFAKTNSLMPTTMDVALTGCLVLKKVYTFCY